MAVEQPVAVAQSGPVCAVCAVRSVPSVQSALCLLFVASSWETPFAEQKQKQTTNICVCLCVCECVRLYARLSVCLCARLSVRLSGSAGATGIRTVFSQSPSVSLSLSVCLCARLSVCLRARCPEYELFLVIPMS